MSRLQRLKTQINFLYNGSERPAVIFRYLLLFIDLGIVLFFVLISFTDDGAAVLIIDWIIAAWILADFLARLFIVRNRWRFLIQSVSIADLVVMASLVAAAFVESFAFLRIVRTLRLLRSFHVLKDLRSRYRFFANNEEVIQSVLNLTVFVFIVTALVFVFQVRSNPNVNNYVDALYFTVATLTTTGFGDITLQGPTGRLLSILIMVVGVGLFLRLVQTIFRPSKAHYTCPDCGLNRHDHDAVHCKHCGKTIKIETEGL